MTEHYIVCGDIQLPTEKDSIEMITKMTEHYILRGDIQIATEKNSSVSK